MTLTVNSKFCKKLVSSVPIMFDDNVTSVKLFLADFNLISLEFDNLTAILINFKLIPNKTCITHLKYFYCSL